MKPIIEGRGLRKEFGTVKAVDDITFSVMPGEVFGFLGPNGAGKTTTMKMIECVSPATSGMLTVFGLDVNRDPRGIKRWLGVVPQETNLDPDFTTLENLLVYARYFGIPSAEARQRSEELLSFVQLSEKRDVPIEKLSGGMKRRLILARALVNSPRLLILDEPTIGLDPQARHLMWEKLKALQAAGNTIVLTTHYLEEAERLCNRLVIMDHGKILVEGTPGDLIRQYAGEDVVEADYTPRVVRCLEEIGARFEVHGDMVQVFSDRPKEVATRLLSDCNPGRVFVRRGSLEDVFLSLTGRALRD
ncbi:MAG: Trehalose/maltose import ATP-binding protein MalK [Methanoregulaceae archaeon PtaU1.Bin059]|nr:MAG: Trehalose/maltose import ATP-binding protein MalK [Methanoregulaceae archaeon PtaB.Bin152]OPY41233.1 MAG: Trehalose/maltose import ATP-binding protein MalK [Methanoregulaceae archaeon PtaU1.Bin059]